MFLYNTEECLLSEDKAETLLLLFQSCVMKCSVLTAFSDINVFLFQHGCTFMDKVNYCAEYFEFDLIQFSFYKKVDNGCHVGMFLSLINMAVLSTLKTVSTFFFFFSFENFTSSACLHLNEKKYEEKLISDLSLAFSIYLVAFYLARLQPSFWVIL